MYELKTKVNNNSVMDFIMNAEEKRREDSIRLLDIFYEMTGEEPKMWGNSIVGYGTYRYKYASGQEGDWMRTGFSPRKAALTLYVSLWLPEIIALLPQLGKYKTGKGCLYISKLDNVDMSILKTIIKRSYENPWQQ